MTPYYRTTPNGAKVPPVNGSGKKGRKMLKRKPLTAMLLGQTLGSGRSSYCSAGADRCQRQPARRQHAVRQQPRPDRLTGAASPRRIRRACPTCMPARCARRTGMLYPYPHQILRRGRHARQYGRPDLLVAGPIRLHPYQRRPQRRIPPACIPAGRTARRWVACSRSPPCVTRPAPSTSTSRGSRISSEEWYYRLRTGRYGDYHVEAFYFGTLPHTLSTTAYPLWNGVLGSYRLPEPAQWLSPPAARRPRCGPWRQTGRARLCR